MLKISANKEFISGESCHSILSARGGLVQNPSVFPLRKVGQGVVLGMDKKIPFSPNL